MQRRARAIFLLSILSALDIFVWYQIALAPKNHEPQIHFLDVGQGDAALLMFPTGVKLLIDAGPDGSVVKRLEEKTQTQDKYIDLVMITHPQLDHFGGLKAVLKHYSVGAVLINGRGTDTPQADWEIIFKEIEAQGTAVIKLKAGDTVRNSNSQAIIVSPEESLIQSAELNDTSLVALVQMPPIQALFTGDIDSRIEKSLVDGRKQIQANILKVAHHGSKTSSYSNFLRAVNPSLAVISVGRGNRYGHPSSDVLDRLQVELPSLKTFRTDLHGTVSVFGENQKLKVFVQK